MEVSQYLFSLEWEHIKVLPLESKIWYPGLCQVQVFQVWAQGQNLVQL